MESKHLWITRILHVLLSFKLFLMKACQYGQCCLPLKQTSKASFDCTYMSAQYFLRCSSMFMSYTKLVSLMTCPFLCGTYKSAILPKLRQTSTCGGWKSRGANESLVPSFCCCLGRWQRIERNRLKEQTHERGQGFEVDMFLQTLKLHVSTFTFFSHLFLFAFLLFINQLFDRETTVHMSQDFNLPDHGTRSHLSSSKRKASFLYLCQPDLHLGSLTFYYHHPGRQKGDFPC